MKRITNPRCTVASRHRDAGSFECDFLRTASYCAIYQYNLPAETVPGKLKNFHGQFTAAFNNANQFNAGR